MGVYSREDQPDEGRKRNSFDGSCQVNTTFNFGQLVPCLCREVIGGDSFRINAAFGLRFMPTAFPLQTKMKAKLDFFYVRYRNLWNGWKNFYTKVGQPDAFPILSPRQAKAQSITGSLGDYLGLPSTIVGPNTIKYSLSWYSPIWSNSPVSARIKLYGGTPPQSITNKPQGSEFEGYQFVALHSQLPDDSNAYGSILKADIATFPVAESDSLYDSQANYSAYRRLPFSEPLPSSIIEGLKKGEIVMYGAMSMSKNGSNTINVSDKNYVGDPLYQLGNDGSIYILEASRQPDLEYLSLFISLPYGIGYNVNDVYPAFSNVVLPQLTVVVGDTEAFHVVEATSVLDTIPYKISALPFRAYEQIYNAFYRDDRNNPYIVNCVNDPNVFLPTYAGGEDDNSYRIRYRNWEQDFLTTALPSPQYGNAPLVGITRGGVATFQAADGTSITSKLSVAENGDTVVGFSTTSDPSVNRTLVEMASSGISINDLRGVNSLQRYLEAKYRASLRYRDQMKIHFGVDIKYDELDMPEFLGSVTTMVNVDQINQSAPAGDDPLGSYAGQLSAMGGSNNNIQHYFDEPGLLIGIISVVPVPVYSQLLPKHFTKTNDAFDYYFSEFAHLGYQAIPYREVCPLQADNQGIPLDSTFGYQRPWYDYISATDEVHGQFRTSLNNFVMARVFNTVPSLNEEFLTIRPESLNDVFTVNSVEVDGKKVPVDPILGQIHFDITMQRPIPRFGVPRLE